MKLDSSIQMVFGGDVCFDQEIRTIEYLSVYRLKTKQDQTDCYPAHYPSWQSSSPFVRLKKRVLHKVKKIYNAVKINSHAIELFEEFIPDIPENENRRYVDNFAKTAKKISIDYPPGCPIYEYPFKNLRSFLKSKDFVIVNLETPLANNCRIYGYFISRPEYAEGMAEAGISMVNLANNHIFDAGEKGFIKTIEHLKKARILFAGAGDNYEKARKGVRVRIKQTNLAFLGYTQYCNARFASIAKDYPGILALDVESITEDILNARKNSDLVFVMLHWGFENERKSYSRAQEIAHALLDAGADAIIGHHPHVPQEIEIYKNKPIFYSLGNFIFGHYREYLWSDNCLVELKICEKRIREIIVYPISGKNGELFQPYFLKGQRAQKVLTEMQGKSRMGQASFRIEKGLGIIEMDKIMA